MTRIRIVARLSCAVLALLLVTALPMGCGPSADTGTSSAKPSGAGKDTPDPGAPSPDATRAGEQLPEGELKIGEDGRVEGDDSSLTDEQRAELKAAKAYVVESSDYKNDAEFTVSGIRTAKSGSDTWLTATVVPMKAGGFLYLSMRRSGGGWEGVAIGPRPQPDKVPADVRADLFPGS